MFGRLLTAMSVLAFLPVVCLAQSNSAAPPSANSTPPATSSNTNSTAPPAKKVWTNDDLPSAKPSTNDKRKQDTGSSSSQTADAATVERIRKNLQKLQGQLEDVNKKLKSYQDFQNGESVSTGAREMDKGVNHVPVDQQILQLQEKKKDLEAQISDLYDEARKKGIDPGQLR
jgi:uncharacterized protein (UPF0335 family)